MFCLNVDLACEVITGSQSILILFLFDLFSFECYKEEGKEERSSLRKLTAHKQDRWHGGSDATVAMAHFSE